MRAVGFVQDATECGSVTMLRLVVGEGRRAFHPTVARTGGPEGYDGKVAIRHRQVRESKKDPAR
jgi:hypothetical protein